MKKSFFSAILSVVFMFSACSSSENGSPDSTQDNPDSKEVTLKMTYSEWPPDMITYLAQEKGFFENFGVNVELIKVYDFNEIQERREAGEADVWTYTLLDLVTEHATSNNTEAQVFLIEDYSFGADGIIASKESGVKKVSDLKDKIIAVEQGFLGEFFLNIVLQKENLTLNDVTLVEANAEEAVEKVKNGEVDVGVTYEPYLSSAINNDNLLLVVSSEQERGTIVDVYAANSSHISQHPEAYKNLSLALLEADKFFRENPDESAEIIKDELGMTAEEVIQTFETFELPTLRDNETAFDRNSGFASLYNLSQLAKQYLEDQGVLEFEFDLDEIINSDVLNSLNSLN